MQPNQQNFEQPPTNPEPDQQSGFANAPAYLGLTPVDPPVARKTKKRIVTAGLILILVAALLVAGWFGWQWIRGADERRFDQVLSKHMTKGLVSRQYVLTDSLKKEQILKIDAKSDFTEFAKPKGTIRYEYENPSGKTLISGQLVMPGDKSLVANLAGAPTGFLNRGVEIDKWYRLESGAKTRLLVTLDTFNLFRDLNTPLATVLSGGFSSKDSDDLVQRFRKDDVYKVEKTSSAKIVDDEVTVFRTSVDKEAFANITGEISKQFNNVSVPRGLMSMSNVSSTIDFWVENESNAIRKIVYSTSQSSTNPPFDVEILLDYPSSVEVTLPRNIITPI